MSLMHAFPKNQAVASLLPPILHCTRLVPFSIRLCFCSFLAAGWYFGGIWSLLVSLSG
jgi:hypothetical protein